jgi:hypothetical protein
LLALPFPDNENVDSLLKSFQPDQMPPFTLKPNLLDINAAFSKPTLQAVLDELSQNNSQFAKAQLAAILKMVRI